jgi:[NiFe] hydrogenase diaphorase moiety large subunit
MLVSEAERIKENVAAWADRYGRGRSALLPILHEVQQEYRRIPEYALQEIANALGLHPTEVYGVVSFYSFLDHRPQGRYVIRLCRSVSCDLQENQTIERQLENELGIRFGETTPDRNFTLGWTGCLGMCDQGPALLVNDRVVACVTPDLVHELVKACRHHRSIEALLKGLPGGSPNPATRPLTFARHEAGAGLEQALKVGRAAIIDEIAASGLRGRGGAGFPASVKWNLAAAARDTQKYVICNADEGEPGTFKDRVILTSHPEILFEGMTIAARAIGAGEGILYLRQEYSYLVPTLEQALASLRERNLLGSDLWGSGFHFDIRIHLGAGAYVCGEETALIESLEGNRGEPRNRPPFPVDTGFHGHPTIVNNVETLAWVACILARGASWFAQLGTEKSKGLKLLSVSGDCERPGVVEVPFGTTVLELLVLVGGEQAKAVQIGGAAGVCVPPSQFGRRIAFEDIPTGGSVIVLGPERDLLAVARSFLEFFVEESCGQCTPCREGNVQLLRGVELLARGECSLTQLRALKALGQSMQDASKCGLGQSSPNAFLSIVEHFKSEILGRAPAGNNGR